MNFQKYTERVRKIFENAQTEALLANHQQLTPLHVLKALLEEPEGITARLLRDSNGDLTEIIARTNMELEKLPVVEGAGAGPVYLSAETVAASTRKIIEALPIPQIEVDFVVTATITSQLLDPSENHQFVTEVYDGKYMKLTFESPIIHLKEFGSFYEKENFDIEVYEITDYSYNSLIEGDQPRTSKSLLPKKFAIPSNVIVNDILVDEPVSLFGTTEPLTSGRVEYYFDIEVDSEISQEELCQAVQNLEINNQFLDEEIICPDQRTERFNIYSSRVSPDDLEDCD